ncbi:MAG: hypothetical protein R3F20_14375 [Planctomycetota bacterium]
MPPRPPTLRAALGTLVRHHGDGEDAAPPTNDPFELVLFENVAYLAKPARRLEAWSALVERVGVTPDAILAAPLAKLRRITAHGILKDTFAEKLRDCARIARDRADGDLAAALDVPVPAAKKLLRAFPGIGEPGAEKILLFSGRHPFVALESNGLRVLQRLGLVPADLPYAKAYAAAREITEKLPDDFPTRRRAHLVLREHGRVLCRNTRPLCVECPLRKSCPSSDAEG